MNERKLEVNKAGAGRVVGGHPWVFRDDLVNAPKEGAGEVFPLYDGKGRFLGQGFYNPRSRIAFRLITRDEVPVDPAFWKQRIEEAVRYRESLAMQSNARRLIYSEADGFPGLIVDEYNRCLVLQILSLGMENLRDMLLKQNIPSLPFLYIVYRSNEPVPGEGQSWGAVKSLYR